MANQLEISAINVVVAGADEASAATDRPIKENELETLGVTQNFLAASGFEGKLGQTVLLPEQDPIVIAEQGFAMYHLMHNHILASIEDFLRWDETRALFFLKDKVISVGSRVFNKDLAKTFKRMIRKEENFSSSSRESGIRAARDEIYSGEIAKEIIDFVE